MKFYEKLIIIVIWEIVLFSIITGYFYDLKGRAQERETIEHLVGEIDYQMVIMIKIIKLERIEEKEINGTPKES